MDMLTKLQKLYEEYYVKSAKVRQKASPVAGLFGMGDDPRRHYCHEAFYEGVGEWVEEFMAARPDSQRLVMAVRFILGAAAEHRDEDAYWYLYAAHGHVRPLIPLLPAEECKVLAQWYDEKYPKLDRMPVQNEVFKLLQKGGKQKNRLF